MGRLPLQHQLLSPCGSGLMTSSLASSASSQYTAALHQKGAGSQLCCVCSKQWGKVYMARQATWHMHTVLATKP